MGRITMIGRIAGLLGALILVLMLSSCEDLAGFVAHLDDEVKLANDDYLEVVSTFPVQNDNNLSPRLEILVTFDRSVDPEALEDYILVEQRDISGDTSVFGDEVDEGVQLSFNERDLTLSIVPDPFLDGGGKATVTLLSGAPGRDGSVLRDPVSWSFYTVKMPVGVVRIADGPDADPDALEGYTNDSTPDLSLIWSYADEYFLTKSEADKDTAVSGGAPDPWWTKPSPNNYELELEPGPISWSTQGEKTVYVVYRNTVTSTISLAGSDTVVFDATPPTGLEAGSNVTSFTNTPISRTIAPSDAGSGMQKVLWSSPDGALFSDDDGATTTIQGPAGDYIDNMAVQVEAFDRAGNSVVDSFTMDWDAEPPNAPDIDDKDAQSVDTDFSWSSDTVFRAHESSGGFSSRFGYLYLTAPPPLKPVLNYGSWSSYSGATSRTGTIPAQKGFLYPPVGHYVIGMQVREQDQLENESTSATEQVYYTEVRPHHGSSVTVLRGGNVSFDWPNYLDEGRSPAYTFYWCNAKDYPTFNSTSVGSDTSVTVGGFVSGNNYLWSYRFRDDDTVYQSPVFGFSVN